MNRTKHTTDKKKVKVEYTETHENIQKNTTPCPEENAPLNISK